MDPKKARKAAAEQIKELRAHAKALSSDLDQLRKLAEEQSSRAEKLQSAIGKLKPAPDGKATIGSNPELRKLLLASKLAEASARYEKSHAELSAGLSRTGQQRTMLKNLVSMLNICVEQHTGGKAGEAFESRRDTRLIHLALKGLQTADAAHQKAEKAVKDFPEMSRQQWEDRRIGDMKLHAKAARDASRAADGLQSAFDGFTTAFDDASADAVKGIAMADQDNSA
jgi:hypothetical protein